LAGRPRAYPWADAAGGQLLDAVAGVGQGTREAVGLGDHQGVAGAASRERLAGPGGTAQSIVGAHPVDVDPECGDAIPLGGESWLVVETLA